MQLSASLAELEDMLRAYVEDIPQSVVLVIAVRPEFVGHSGTSELSGVVAGMVLARVGSVLPG